MRTWLSWVVAIAMGACGDNSYFDGVPLTPTANLTIVAHQDDDLLFMQPDLYEAVRGRAGVINVYVTAGNANGGVEFSEKRNAGLMAAYGAAAGADDWFCGWLPIAGHQLQHCRLEAGDVSLVFLGYPDGGKEGMVRESLQHLWEGKVSSVTTIARQETRYDRTGVVDVLAQIIEDADPITIRTLEVASTHGYDHADHMMVGALAVLATAQSSRDPELISYRGYNGAAEPGNANPLQLTRVMGALAYYEACATGCAPCGQPCPLERIWEAHLNWLQHRYTIGMRTGDGQLRQGDGCVAVTGAGDNAAIVDCARAPTWQLDRHGTLRASTGVCLRALFTGEVVGSSCGDVGPGGRFLLDDEGHLWSGIVPPPEDDMSLAHLDCMVASGGRPRVALCGADRAPTWELVRTMTATPRDTTTITRTGRAVRMATLPRDPQAMLCAIETGTRGLMCAPSTTGGGLLPAVRVDSSAVPLAVEPESLVLGDIDGDGMTDACGRGVEGLVCATAAGSYRAAPWSMTLGGSGPATATDRSLAIVPGGQICGLDGAGVVCVAKDSTAITDIRSTWPDRGAALWFANLDDDRAPDWCTATPTGPACSLAADRRATTDGVAWGYATGGQVQGSASDGAIPDTANAVFTDIDGDGRDDLCSLRDGAIACARSLGRGFAPRSVVARLPPGMVPASVWAEPAATGRAPRICAADATTIACTD